MESLITLPDLQMLVLLFTAPWVILALFAAFGDASVGYIDEWLLKKLAQPNKNQTNETIDAPGRLLLISGFFGFVVCAGALVASLLIGGEYSLKVAPSSMWLAIAAGVLEVMWMIPYFHALQRGGAINTTPLFQTIPIFSLIFGVTLFNEIPLLIHIVATILIVSGASLLNYSPQSKKTDFRTISLMLIASAIISIGFFLFKDAALSGNFVATLFGNGLGMGLFSTFIWIAWPPYRRQFNDFIHNLNPKVLLLQVSNEGLYAVSTMASQLAIVIGPSVMIVTAFNAFHPIFTLLIGWSLAKLGSNDHAKSLVGSQLITKTTAIILIAIGTVLISI